MSGQSLDQILSVMKHHGALTRCSISGPFILLSQVSISLRPNTSTASIKFTLFVYFTAAWPFQRRPRGSPALSIRHVSVPPGLKGESVECSCCVIQTPESDTTSRRDEDTLSPRRWMFVSLSSLQFND